jgi:flagellar hook-associated protein 2
VSNAINAANTGVSAAVVSNVDGTARLALTSKDTGLTNQIMVTTTGVGFTDFSYPPSALTGAGMTQSQAAQNAQLSVNGVPVESTSNNVTSALDGLTLTLTKESATPVKITVANDEATQKKAVEDFVAAYNALNNYLAEQTKYDESSKKASPLQGDNSVASLRAQMRGMVAGIAGVSSAFSRLSDVGVETQKDGSLSINSTKLTAALKRPDEMSKLFANTDTATSSNNGFGVRLRQLADAVTGFDGVLSTRSSALQGKLKRNQDEQARQEDRVSRVQARLQKQYQALDAKMGSLTTLSNYVTQQITTWNKSSG